MDLAPPRSSRGDRPASASAARDIVAVVSHSHPSLSKGGAETSAYALFRGLQALGIEAVFIAACPDSARDRLVLDPACETAVFYEEALYDHVFQLAAPDTMRDLVTAVQRSRATIVSFHHYFNFGIGALKLTAALTGTRNFLTLHEFLAICQNHGQMITRPAGVLCEQANLLDCAACFPELPLQKIALRRSLMTDALLTMDGFISPSAFLAGRYVQWGLPANRMHVAENGLLRLFDEVRAPSPSTARPFVFGFFGQINPFKGVDLLLEAAAIVGQMPGLRERVRIRVHGNIIGQPEAFVARLATAREKHGFLTFSGPYNNATVGQLMADCDYIVVPSKWWENSPVVIQEAFGVGRPVICAGIGGMAEKVPHGIAGLNFRAGDATDLVRVIETAIEADTFDRLLRSLPRPYDARAMAARYMEVFRGESEPIGWEPDQAGTV